MIRMSILEKNACRDKTRRLVANGTIVLTPCEKCGSTDKIHTHHEDYTDPTNVNCLCRDCHVKYHALLRSLNSRHLPYFYKNWLLGATTESEIKKSDQGPFIYSVELSQHTHERLVALHEAMGDSTAYSITRAIEMYHRSTMDMINRRRKY